MSDSESSEIERSTGSQLFSSTPQDLQPWIVVQDSSGVTNSSHEFRCATWQVEKVGEAIACFSSAGAAERFASSQQSSGWRADRPDVVQLAKILMAVRELGIQWIVLDPGAATARQLFRMNEVLRGIRENLKAMRPF